MARPEHDLPAALAALADELGAPPIPTPDYGPRATPASGAVTTEALGQSLAALLPEDAVIADESVSFGRGLYPNTHGAPPHDWLQITGGAIGCGIPLATGAAIGAPGRRVVNLQADGSAMYTLQGLWTQAREKLDVTTIILANRKYAILLGELANVGANPGRTALEMLDIGNPDLDFVALAAGMGVEAARAHNYGRIQRPVRPKHHPLRPVRDRAGDLRMFFFEKKNQRTFDRLLSPRSLNAIKSLFASFSTEKEDLRLMRRRRRVRFHLRRFEQQRHRHHAERGNGDIGEHVGVSEDRCLVGQRLIDQPLRGGMRPRRRLCPISTSCWVFFASRSL